MASTSASSVQESFKYDVFLSFRGEDTRKTFVDHLYHALHQKGIITYKDDENIQRGEKINDELIRSIEESRIHIIVFSSNYASSSWCLDELVKIMECQKTTEQTAYPIFFDVEPTEVRHQSGAFGEAFAKHENASWNAALPDRLCSILAFCCSGSSSLNSLTLDLENEDDVGRWRTALKEAADIAGMELKNTFNGHEAKFIQQIVQEISQKLQFNSPSVDAKLVGMETRVNYVVSSMKTDPHNVRMIGIKGMGGGGKTTLARAVFDHIFRKFEGRSFVENVREVSKGSLSGLKELQKKVLSDVLNDQSIVVTSVSEGKTMMKKRMRSRKVLVVLDDVDDIDQLEALAGELTWFKPGSRIIITTRDQQVLVAHGVDCIHDVNLLSHEEAICLFCRYAFKREIPNQGYEELSRKVVHYAAGLPLTIKVLGSHLCGRSEPEWVDAIERLKTIPLEKTMKRLEISYDGLENDQKEIFLDVVCMLKGEEKDYAIRILESRGFNAQIGLSVLEQKSLITISYTHHLQFHDHIEEMGWNIVRRTYPDEPNRHNRLWIKDEIEDIIFNELGTEETRCVKLEFTDTSPAIIMRGLRKMKELRFLYVNNASRECEVDEAGQYLPYGLRSLTWHKYPFQSLPKSFRADKLVNLEMHSSNISQLWEKGERKVLNKLRYIDLSRSKLRIFDLGMTPHLEKLVLEECHDFVELRMLNVYPKLKFLHLTYCKVSNLNLGLTPHLKELNLEECDRLQEIHAPVGCLKNLIYLNLSGCSRFEIFVVDKRNVLPGLDSLAKLRLNAWSLDICPLHPNKKLPNFVFECFYDEPLPSSSGNLEKILSFGLCACTNLESLSENICGLEHLRELTLEGGIPEMPKDLCNIQSLSKLSLWMKEFKYLQDNICELKHLKYLNLKSCFLLEQLPKDLGKLECLKELHLTDCRSLRDIPKSISKMKSLTCLNLSCCILVEKLPEELGCMESLEMLNLCGCRSLRGIPNSICKMRSLTYLNLSYCHQVDKLPEELGRLECLEELNLTDCRSLQDIPNSICNIKSLTYWKLAYCLLVEKLPEELGSLKRLKELNIRGAGISCLPHSIYQLKGLCIIGYPKHKAWYYVS